MIDIARLQAGSELVHRASGIAFEVKSVRIDDGRGGYVELEDGSLIPEGQLEDYDYDLPKARGVRLSCPRCGAACTIEHLASRPECGKHIKSLAAIRSRSMRRFNSRAGGSVKNNRNALKIDPAVKEKALAMVGSAPHREIADKFGISIDSLRLWIYRPNGNKPSADAEALGGAK